MFLMDGGADLRLTDHALREQGQTLGVAQVACVIRELLRRVEDRPMSVAGQELLDACQGMVEHAEELGCFK